MYTKHLKVLVLTAIFMLLFSGIALAATRPSFSVEIDGNPVHDGGTYITASSKVQVVIVDEHEVAKSLLINGSAGGKTVEDEVYTWELKDYTLTVGNNDLTIRDENKSESYSCTIIYTNSLVTGLKYKTDELPANKIELFNKGLVINYPADTVLVDDEGKPVVTEIRIYTEEPDGSGPVHYNYWASPNDPLVVKVITDEDAKLLFPGTLTLAFNSNISQTVAEQVSVWYSTDNVWDDSDNINLGGIVDAKNYKVTVPFQQMNKNGGYYAVFLSDRQFMDFMSNNNISWAYTPVMALWAKGYMAPDINDERWFGLLNGRNQKMASRLEFITMLVKGWGLPLVSQTYGVFRDVPSSGEGYSVFPGYPDNSTYYMPSIAKYVETAVRSGIIKGYPGGSFKPKDSLSREEAAVIMAHLAGLKLVDDDTKARTELARLFEDSDKISAWAAPSVLAAQKAGLIKGFNGSKTGKFVFSPKKKLTRAEAATFTYRMLKKYKKM